MGKQNELGFQEVAAILSPLRLYGGNQKTKLPLTLGYTPPRGILGNFVVAPSDGCPATANLLSLDASLAIPTRVLHFEVYRLRRRTPVRPVLLTGQTSSMLLHLRLRSSILDLRIINQGTQWFSCKPPETPRSRYSLRQSSLKTRLPRSPDSILVLRLSQETAHDFILLFLPPCSPHLNPLATGSLKPSLLVFSTPGGLTGNDLSRLFFTCTNTSQAATCACNT
jgi:hypothetical protein